jgi:hypothetical protein
LNLLRYDCKFTLPEAALGSLRATSEGMGWEQNKEVRRGGGGRAEPFAGASPANVEDETDGAFYFLGRKFIPGDTFGFETEAFSGDIERIVKAVVEAQRHADWVIVSLHQQGAGRSKEEAPDHSVALANAVLRAGADVFVAHGAGRVGGIEYVNSGVAIYGQGSWLMNLDQVKRLPLEMMQRFGLDYQDEAGQLLDIRANREEKTGAEHGARRASIEESGLSTITTVELGSEGVTGVNIFPVKLATSEESRHLSGLPRLLSTDSSNWETALGMVDRRSQVLGTRVRAEGSSGLAVRST